MFNIFDYDLEQALAILKESKDITFRKHAVFRAGTRNVDLNYLEKTMVNNVPLSISKTMENRFKLIYPHETKKSEDVYVIIEITDYQEVETVTIYTYNINRRIREYEI